MTCVGSPLALAWQSLCAGDEQGTLTAVISDFGLHTLVQKSGVHSPSPDTTM